MADLVPPNRPAGIQLVPSPAPKIVGMAAFRDTVVVATESGVFMLVEKDGETVWKPVPFKPDTAEGV